MYETIAFLITAPAVLILWFSLSKMPHVGTIKKVVVVNDCGYVWEDLKPYLPQNVKWQFITRNRSLWGKTFGIFFKILFSKGDFYIANFALQDAWLVQKLKHLDLLICHGGDVRWTIKKKRLGWMVRSNLKAARQVAFTVDDLEETMRKFRPDAFFLHRPIQIEKYVPDKHSHSKLSAVYFEKPYDKLNFELVDLLNRNNCTLTVVARDPAATDINATGKDSFVPHRNMPAFLRNFDVFVDHMAYDGSVSKLCLEAMSCGLCTITWRDKNRLPERVQELLNPDARRKEGVENRRFVEENHNAATVAVTVQKAFTH